MADFPALEVVSVGGHGPPRGTRFPLAAQPLVIGRGVESGLVVRDNQVSRRHCMVVSEYGRWWVRDLGSATGTWVGGERVNDAELEHGACFVVGSFALRLLEREPEPRQEPHLEAAIRAAPDDERPWMVYADWLQEQGDPLGLRLANPQPDEDARWLGPLSVLPAKGDLQVRWAHGLPSGAVLRLLHGPMSSEVTWERRFATLLEEPAFRFLRWLELDVRAFTSEPALARWATSALLALGEQRLPMLETLTLGPCTPPGSLDGVEAALAKRRAAWPCFATTAATLFRPWAPARLHVEGRAVELARGLHDFGPGTANAARGVETSASFTLEWADDRWVLQLRAGRLTVNGVGVYRAHLRGGDVLRFPEGTTMAFEA